MKTFSYILLFLVMINFKSIGQKATNQESISNTKTIKGKHLLRKEKRIHNSSENIAEKNELKSRRKHKLGTLSNYQSQKKMIARERKKSKRNDGKKEESRKEEVVNNTEPKGGKE